ncbi:C6 zinc finger domain-containing protein [Blumeria hordei DH14]|uniref:C6 zinc finger domain-containing protein n=1 Tax=Blumeria graminis f. sp. hordei (strain DH14) TaxID=546991 RepID=N1JLN3_BLUG1|nr:C6 zinc finger domain-containing protein [Blumeria hordei DH14]
MVIQCDEQYPTCGPCAKRQLPCDFGSTRSQSSLSDYLGTSPRHSISPRLGTNSPISASPEISQIDSDTTTRLVELKLFHHFSTQTYRTIAFKAADHVILQKYVPEIALSHPFLMNVIFAMAALHLEWLDPNRSKSWLRIGLNYQNRTLAKFTGVLQEINKQNCEAVALCSMFISVTSLAVPAVTSDEISVDPFSEISSRRSLSEGIHNILRAYESDLTTGPLKGCSVLESISWLKGYIKKHPMENQEALLESCTLFEDFISPLSRIRIVTGSLFWIVSIDIKIIQQLNINIMSRLIFLHYGVIIHVLRDRWFVDGAGKRIIASLIENIETSDSEEFKNMILWARSVVGL